MEAMKAQAPVFLPSFRERVGKRGDAKLSSEEQLIPESEKGKEGEPRGSPMSLECEVPSELQETETEMDEDTSGDELIQGREKEVCSNKSKDWRTTIV